MAKTVTEMQLRILKTLAKHEGWATREEIGAVTGDKQGFSKALGDPTNPPIKQESLEGRGYVERRTRKGTQLFEYRITARGKRESLSLAGGRSNASKRREIGVSLKALDSYEGRELPDAVRSLLSKLPKLRIGDLTLDFPVVQAALSGYSDMPMRLIARRLGAPYTLCEVMLDKFIVDLKPRRRNRHFLHVADEEHPTGGQLMGAEPHEFGAAARRLAEAGFDVIDVNFGCPVKKVLGRCRGGFHLSQPAVALEIVRRVREAVPADIPVTVKMRRGIDDSHESRDKFFEIFDGAYELGVAAITVHGRTVTQRYDGPSRWEFLREVKRHAGTRTVLGSGDLFSAQACLDMLAYTGVDGVTVARGAIGNPWIFAQARALAAGRAPRSGRLPDPPTLHEQRAVIAEHYRLAEELYGPDRCLADMRKFAIKYSKLHPFHQQVRADFCRVKRPHGWRDVLDKWYAADAPGVHPRIDEPNPAASDADLVAAEA